MTGLAAWRWLDWRFLLPEPPQGRVALLGAHPGPAAELLQALPAVTAVDRPPTQGSRATPYDLVVVGPGTTTAEVARQCGPTTTVVSLGGPPLAGPSVRTWWHAPSRVQTSYLAALDDRAALRQLLSRHHGVRLGRLKAAGAGLALATGRIGALARDTSQVTGPGTRPPQALLEAELGRSVLHVTPWFAASRHVVGLGLEPGSTRLAQVAKLPRRPGDVDGIDREAAALRLVADRAPLLSGRAPLLLGRRALGSEQVLVVSALRGPPLDPAAVRRHRGLDGLVERLLHGFPVTGSTSADQEWFARLLGAPLDRFERSSGLLDASALVAQTHALLAPLQAADLPLVMVHGDLGHPNLIQRRTDGELAAVDWERAQLRGLPLQDLVFLEQYVAEARAGVFDRPGQCRALDRHLIARDGRGRLRAAAELARLGIPAQLYPLLLLATWVIAATGLIDRVGADEDGAALHTAVRDDRDVALWRHTVSALSARP